MKKAVFCLLLCCFLLPGNYAAAQENFDSYFENASAIWGTPKSLAIAIAKIESGIKPWAINIAGISRYYKSKEEVMSAVRQARKDNKPFDLGVMQVSSYWLTRLNLRAEDVLEPRLNILLGNWILAQEINRFGLTWKAIGSYHTPLHRNPARARAYAIRVLEAWEVK